MYNKKLTPKSYVRQLKKNLNEPWLRYDCSRLQLPEGSFVNGYASFIVSIDRVQYFTIPLCSIVMLVQCFVYMFDSLTLSVNVFAFIHC